MKYIFYTMNKSGFQRDYQFYFKNRKRFSFCGCVVPDIPSDPDSISAMEAFYIFDSRGQWKPCKEEELLKEIWICKKSINFHIKLWVHGYNDAMIGIPELLSNFIDPPEWVEKALRGQLVKRASHIESTPVPINLVRTFYKIL